MSETDWAVREVDTADLPFADLSEVRRLMGAAFGDRFSEVDWRHALGGRHFIIRRPGGSIVSHASVVGRKLEVSGHQLSTGYVEAVATLPEFQSRGLATAVMRSVGEFIQAHFQLGALSGDPRFYEKLGWVRWLGATWCRGEEGLFRTADEDRWVLILSTQSSPRLDLKGDIAVDWRGGDVW